MKNIYLSLNYKDDIILRQTPESKGIWNDCHYFLNDEMDSYDGWVVQNSTIAAEIIKCDPKKVFLITGEPWEIMQYPSIHTKQFSQILTSNPEIKGNNVVYSQPGIPWWIGRTLDPRISPKGFFDIDDFRVLPVPKKKKNISVITSNKALISGHKKRIEFVNGLKDHFGPDIDVFGRGINEVKDKWDAIVDYKYHICLENSSSRDYWTEKIGDAFLGWSFPIYFGCPNIGDYFPEGSFVSINMDDFEGSVRSIEKLLYSETYENSIEKLSSARNLVTEKYNFFSVITDMVDCSSSARKKSWVFVLPLRNKKRKKARFFDYVHILLEWFRKLRK